ncbi:MAG TPA: 50S ribosomal protein L25 [Gammaproteobacteria bacterium]|nr:50S ribosomal protein L25 [Gammaproteobacteria bacterium]
MSDSNTITAVTRDEQGTSASRRLRHAGNVPAILYGAGKDTVKLTLDHNSLYHSLENEAFHSSILNVEVDGKSEKAILRDVQMHPYKLIVMHVDLQRVSATDKIHMSVPFHFTGGDEAPGVKLESGIISHLITELEINCLPDDLPEYIDVDVSGLNIGDSIHITEVNLPKGVESASMAHGGDDLAVVTCIAVRASKADEAEEAGLEAAAEGEAGEEAADEEAGEE